MAYPASIMPNIMSKPGRHPVCRRGFRDGDSGGPWGPVNFGCSCIAQK